MATAGTVTINFAAETARFTAELKKANTSLSNLEKQANSFAKGFTRAIGVFASAVSLGAVTSFVGRAAKAADELGKVADRVGVTTERLAGFRLAAEEAGVGAQQLDKLLIEAQTRLGQALAGTGEAARFIRSLNLSLEELRNLRPDELFLRYSEAIGNLGTRSEQLAVANALFGETGRQAIELIAGGVPAIEEATTFVERFNIALNRVETRQIENANDALGRLSAVTQAFGQNVAVAVAPYIEAFAQSIVDSDRSAEDLQETIGELLATGFVAFNILRNGALALQSAFFGLAAAGARVLQALTFGDVSEAFAASVDANLAKAEEALLKVQNFAQISQELNDLLERSRVRAEQAIQVGQQAATGTSATSIVQPQLAETTDLEKYIQDEFAKAEEREKIWAEFDTQFETRRLEAARNLAEQEKQIFIESQQAIFNSQANVASAALGLLQAFAGKSKAAALASIALNKGLSIALAVQNTAVAVTRALAELGPVAGPPVAAKIAALGKIQVGIIAATGLAEASNVFSSGGAPLGSPANPVFTQNQQDTQPQFGASAQNVVQIVVEGSILSGPESARWLVDTIAEQINDRDVVIINGNSRQAAELVSG